jgi:hypothetical protein
MQISHFGAVAERYIQRWQRLMPRFTPEQYRLAFADRFQMYGWDLAVEMSGWGTLESYTARCQPSKIALKSNQTPALLTMKKSTVEEVSPQNQRSIAERNALFRKLEMTKMGDVRRKLWHELIKIEEVTGHGLWKAVSKLHASGPRAARMKQD